MTTIQLIEKHFDEHGGKSSYIDQQLQLAKLAAKDAARCLERNEPDYAVANLAVTRSIVNALADLLALYPSVVSDELVTIFHSANSDLDELNELLAATKQTQQAEPEEL